MVSTKAKIRNRSSCDKSCDIAACDLYYERFTEEYGRTMKLDIA